MTQSDIDSGIKKVQSKLHFDVPFYAMVAAHVRRGAHVIASALPVEEPCKRDVYRYIQLYLIDLLVGNHSQIALFDTNDEQRESVGSWAAAVIHCACDTMSRMATIWNNQRGRRDARKRRRVLKKASTMIEQRRQGASTLVASGLVTIDGKRIRMHFPVARISDISIRAAMCTPVTRRRFHDAKRVIIAQSLAVTQH